MMQKFTNISIYNLIFLLFFSANIFSAYSSVAPDKREDKMRERVRTMKKIKLIEVLDLSEDKLDKFIVKYSIVEKNIEKQMKDLDIFEEKLRLAVKEENEKEISEYILKFQESRKKIQKANAEKINMSRELLSDVEFAKFLIFEKVFRKELSKRLFKSRGGRGGRGDNKGRGEKRP